MSVLKDNINLQLCHEINIIFEDRPQCPEYKKGQCPEYKKAILMQCHEKSHYLSYYIEQEIYEIYNTAYPIGLNKRI